MNRIAGRRDKLRRLVRKTGAEAMLVGNERNVTYLTGFTGDSSSLLLTSQNEILLTDGRYTTQLEEECPDLELEVRSPGTRIHELIATVLGKTGIGKLAVESDSMTLTMHAAISKRLSNVELIPTSGLVEQLREIKDKQEVAEIREAIRLAEQAFGVVRAALRPEQTEREVAHELEQQIRLFGGDCCSFKPIVAAGPRAALPHARSGHTKVGQFDFTLIDWGAQGRLYKSDLTRILVTGRISPKLQRMYELVLNAQARAIALIRPGVLMKQVDAAGRTVIVKAGHGRHFNHGLGHGIGLEIHESPRLAENEDRPLKAGMVITVEPGIYLPGWGGIRIEDDVLVTPTGHEVLSHVPKALEECVIG